MPKRFDSDLKILSNSKENPLESGLVKRAGCSVLRSSISKTELFKKNFAEEESDVFHFPDRVDVPLSILI